MDNGLISFLKVDSNNESHHKTLFKILKSRKFNISNDNKVGYKEHKQFVINNPYKEWFFVKKSEDIVGSFYITYENNIGISLFKEDKILYKKIIHQIILSHKPNPEIKSLRSRYFTLNVNPDDLEIQEVFKELGLKKIQITYAIV